MKFNLLILISLFILMFGLNILAVSPFDETDALNGLSFQGSKLFNLELGIDRYYHFFVHDAQTGVILNANETNCTFSLMDNNGLCIDRITPFECLEDPQIKIINISSSLINLTGDYYFFVKCSNLLNTKGVGIQGVINANDNQGLSGFNIWSCPTNFSFLYFIGAFIFFFIYLAIKINERLLGVFAGLMLLVLYFYIGACAPLLTSPILVFGLLVTLWFALT